MFWKIKDALKGSTAIFVFDNIVLSETNQKKVGPLHNKIDGTGPVDNRPSTD